ncbi:MAG: D-sedoheptulose 7-phosphate isomerase [Rhodospirillaceae bacterium]|nr:D-sedoheptulose 7-phosphate isomerase [Rhodospirillaceae bacterium]MCY4238243.1 D-sedoheptulose 7-phosphate isomerase [Rhodospirillaceae bacterium]
MIFDLTAFYNTEFAEHATVTEATRQVLRAPFVALVDTCQEALVAGNKLLFFGNGGSAADAQHIATELTVRYKTDRPAIAAIALTTDTSALTAIGNDYGFDHLFSRQIEALSRPGDVAIGISTSGQSPNVLQGLETARSMRLKTVGLTGRDGSAMSALADLLLVVPSQTTARIQEMHILLGQMLCGALEIRLGLVSGP